MKLYMKCTTDKYELPIAVADSTKELAQILHLANSSVKRAVSREKCGFHKVEIEPDMYPDNDGNLWYFENGKTVYVYG